MTLAVNIAQSGANNVSFRNRIINGAMVIDQRNAGAASTIPTAVGAGYTLDRWRYAAPALSKFTVQQNQGSVTLPVGFSNYLGITSSAATTVAAGDVYIMQQYIEGFNTADLGWGTANAKSVNLSFQVYSSLTGTFGGSLQNSAQNRSYPFTYSISTANTWTTISITIAGDTTGTWIGATNGTGICLTFGLGVGSTYSGTANAWAGANYFSATGATSVASTNGATLNITGVQLEKGSTATSFDYRPYGTEFSLCQRYYETSYPVGYSAGYNFGETYPFSTAHPVTLNLIASDDPTTSQSVRFVVQKRTSPTVVIYSPNNGSSGNTYTYKGTGGSGNLAASVTYASANLWNINQQLGATNQANESYFHFTASAEL
jgi:hypothetical protein